MRTVSQALAGPRWRHRKATVPVTVRPTKADIAVADAIARNTEPAPEAVARALTWCADEKVVLAIAAAGWLATCRGSEPLRRAGNHALLVSVAAALLPHALKAVFNQTRPDRRTIVGHIRGIALSGKRKDAFPSGHALHMGALASAAGALPPRPRLAVRALAVGLSLTRVFLLAHWASDVVAGFALGAALERLLRRWTGYPLKPFKEHGHAGSRVFEGARSAHVLGRHSQQAFAPTRVAVVASRGRHG